MTTAVVEGLDFAGKTTICALVGELLQDKGLAVEHSTTCLSGRPVDDVVDLVYSAPRIPGPVRSAVYHAAYLADTVAARRPKPARVLLQQSYIHRVLAYDRTARMRFFSGFAGGLAPRLAKRVDLSFYLDCPLAVRRQRYRESGSVNERDERRFSAAREPFESALEAELTGLARNNGYVFIDTRSNSARVVAEQIATAISEREGN